MAASAIVFASLMGSAAPAADWGYDQPKAEQEIQPLRAQALPIGRASAVAKPNTQTAAGYHAPAAVAHPRAMPGTAGSGKSTGGLPAASGKTAPAARTGGAQAAAQPDGVALVKECWAAVYQLASGNKLDETQRHDLDALIEREMNGTPAQREQARCVVNFWPKLNAYLIAHVDEKENYGALLRALLRWQARNLQPQAASDPVAEQQCGVTAEILGPLRLAVAGTIPFSEEAVDAYADMACFIYEQQHPGKSVDAMDNRAMFANVVSEKFKDAPSSKDQEAMAAFDLSWAKFKIIWTQADETQRQTLVQALTKSGAGAALSKVHDNMLELVLSHWPNGAPKAPSVASRAGESPRK